MWFSLSVGGKDGSLNALDHNSRNSAFKYIFMFAYYATMLVSIKKKLFKSKKAINMMSKEDRKILNEFTTRVRERFSDAGVWAFGLRARGEATWESD